MVRIIISMTKIARLSRVPVLFNSYDNKATNDKWTNRGSDQKKYSAGDPPRYLRSALLPLSFHHVQ